MENNESSWKTFLATRVFSNVAWDEFSTSLLRSGEAKTSFLQNKGYFCEDLGTHEADTLSELFDQCAAVPHFDGQDRAKGYFFEPRRQMHDYFSRTNTYFLTTTDLLEQVQLFLDQRKSLIEEQCGHPWRIVSFRLFSLRPGHNSGSVHRDGWPLAIKKLFIYPRGANSLVGTTYIRTHDNQEIKIEKAKGAWLMFENSGVDHQAILPLDKNAQPRQTIELDLAPAFTTDTRIVSAGVNGWYPWFPTMDAAFLDRMQRRIAGLASVIPVQDIGGGVDEFLGPLEPLIDKLQEPQPLTLTQKIKAKARGAVRRAEGLRPPWV